MNVKLAIILILFGLLSGCVVKQTICPNLPPCIKKPDFPTCKCTDPTCDTINPCLSREKCCRIFGNVGDPGN